MQYIRSACMFFFFILLGGILSGAGAQGLDTHPARGFMPNADQLSSPVDNIEVASGKLHLQIPLASLPRGKGGTGFDLNLEYDSHLYDVAPVMNYFYWGGQYHPYLSKYLYPVTQSGGWTYSAKNYSIELEGKPNAIVDNDCLQNPLFNEADVRNVRYRLVLPDGSMHVLQLSGYESTSLAGLGDGYNAIDIDGYSNSCARDHYGYPSRITGWKTYYTSDGSYLKLEALSIWDWKLYYPDGRRVISEYGLIKEYDTNGNYISIANVCSDPPPGGDCSQQLYTAIFDAENDPNRTITINYNTTNADLSTDLLKRDEITAPGPNGSVTYKIDWQALEIGADERVYYVGQPFEDLHQVYAPILTRFWTVKYIQLPPPQYRPNYPVPLGQEPPAELSYEFGYWDDSEDGYGQVDHMRMPSGAEYDYQYLARNDSQFGADNIAGSISVSNKKITYDSLTLDPVPHDSVNEMEWVYDYTGGDHTHVMSPGAGQTIYNFQSSWGEKLVTSIEEPSGSIRTRQWAQNTPSGLAYLCCTPNNPYVAKEILTVGNSSGQATKSAIADFSYDKNGNLLSKTEYDWVNYPSTTGVTIKRKTDFDYFVTDYITDYWNPHNTAIWPTGTARRLNSVQRRKISNGSTAYAATEYAYDYPYSKGNVIAEKRWDSVKSPSLPALGQLSGTNSQVLSRGYDSYGNLTDIYEPEVRTHITYDAAGNVVTRVDQGSAPAQRSWQYNWLNGVALEWKKDLDNNLTTSYTYDDVGRQLSSIDKDANEICLRQTLTSYDDANRKVTATGDLRTCDDGKLQSITHYDQLGQVNLVQKSDGAMLNGDTDGIKVQTFDTYPSGGRRVVMSTPYRNTDYSDATLEWTCTQYDQLKRVAAVAMFKGASAPTDCTSTTNRTGVTTTLYDSEWMTVIQDSEYPDTDKIRKQMRDSLGRLVQVIEDPTGYNSPALNYSTAYTYDPLDNLTQVAQGAQTRTFVYSSLSRLTSAANPESGTTSYTYHESGDLKIRTDARGGWSDSEYDPLHRIRTKTYSDSTPAVTYDYHLAGSSTPPNIGQLKSVSSSVAATLYDYNQLGNVTASYHDIGGYSGTPTFTYDWYLNGGLKSIQYPSGRQVSYDVDDAGRSTKVYSTGKTYAEVTYPFTPDGRITQMKVGNNNNLWETHDYNTPGTTTVHKLGTMQGAGDLLQLEYNFSGTNNNGNLEYQVTSRPGNVWRQDFTYDNVNRLSTAIETGGWNQTYEYDQYGNRWVPTSYGLAYTDPKEPVSQSNFTASTNRLTMTGIQYDSAGNQTTYGVFTLGYDAESRNTSATSTSSGSGSFVYDGEGRRVMKVWTPSIGPVVTTYFVYDALGQLAAEYSSEAPTSLGTSYPFTDMLGSVRAITSDSGSVEECYDYLPFGQMLSKSDHGRNFSCYPANPESQQSTSRISQKFTSKERDAETGLDFFGARYYSGAQGRFTSVDPIWVKADRMIDPQRLNLYAYARNNPLKFSDPSGMDITIGACAGGDARKCFALLQLGLRKEDRSHVQLVAGDGENGFKKGAFGVTVDQDYKSDSKNFQTLQKLSGDHSAMGIIDVLAEGDSATVRDAVGWNEVTGLSLANSSMSMKGKNDPFAGFTLFQYRGQKEDGIYYTPGNYSQAIVNSTEMPDVEIIQTMYEELRHIFIGDFGRSAPKAKHSPTYNFDGVPRNDMDRQAVDAGKEAESNAGH